MEQQSSPHSPSVLRWPVTKRNTTLDVPGREKTPEPSIETVRGIVPQDEILAFGNSYNVALCGEIPGITHIDVPNVSRFVTQPQVRFVHVKLLFCNPLVVAGFS